MSPENPTQQFARTVTPRRALGCFVLALPFLLTAQSAHAASKDSMKRAAKTACLSGDYTKGVALLAELYVDTNDPIFIFNQGRCFEQSGRYEDAVIRFREYQRKNADAGHQPDAEAEKHIADCLALLDKQKAPAPEQEQGAASAGAKPAATAGEAGTAGASPATSQPPAAPSEPPISPGPASTPAALPPPVPAPDGPSTASPGLSPDEATMPVQKKLGFAAGGLGLAGIGVGVIAYFVAKDYLDKSSSLGCSDASCTGAAKTEYNHAQTAVTVSNVSAVAGGVLVLGGLVLILTSPSATSASHGVALVPIVGPGLGQLALTGRF
jgi:tetratricopeptide (TPR) repeat protein